MAKKLPVVIDLKEFTELIKNTKSPYHKVAFLFGFGSGLRISEIINLEKRDIDMNEKKVLVRLGKGGKDRVVPLPKGFRQAHLQYIPIKVGIRALQRAFKKTAQIAGLLKRKPTLHFHSLRHGFATHCLSNGMKIHHLQLLLGHSDIKTTGIYLHSNPKDALREYEEFF